MPEKDGNVLPSENRKYRLESEQLSQPNKLKRREKEADKILDIAFIGLNRPRRFAERSFFDVPNKVFEEAVECFRYGQFEASMILVRSTIDAALYVSRWFEITKIRINPAGGTSEFKSVCKGIRSEGAWNELRNQAEKLGYTEEKIKWIEHIREKYGNFSAHIAEKRIQESFNYSKLSEEERRDVPTPRNFTSEEEAKKVLNKVAHLLVDIRTRHFEKFAKEKTEVIEGPNLDRMVSPLQSIKRKPVNWPYFCLVMLTILLAEAFILGFITAIIYLLYSKISVGIVLLILIAFSLGFEIYNIGEMRKILGKIDRLSLVVFILIFALISFILLGMNSNILSLHTWIISQFGQNYGGMILAYPLLCLETLLILLFAIFPYYIYKALDLDRLMAASYAISIIVLFYFGLTTGFAPLLSQIYTLETTVLITLPISIIGLGLTTNLKLKTPEGMVLSNYMVGALGLLFLSIIFVLFANSTAASAAPLASCSKSAECLVNFAFSLAGLTLFIMGIATFLFGLKYLREKILTKRPK
ncbi:MAG: hypothetical protein KGH94_03930 [Candidatus Micrarchaeota archaeon]|nr:hypothetical protein [Candidatus Micrarchaeota archaeon]